MVKHSQFNGKKNAKKAVHTHHFGIFDYLDPFLKGLANLEKKGGGKLSLECNFPLI
jgi:hypothetical protein